MQLTELHMRRLHSNRIHCLCTSQAFDVATLEATDLIESMYY